MRTFKLTDGIDIRIEDSQQSIEKQRFSEFEEDEEDENLERSTIILLLKITSISGSNLNNFKETNVK